MKHNQSLRIVAQRLVLLVAGVCVLSLANAQTAPLSLKEALQQALKNKSEAIKARLDEENGQYKIDQARSLALPQISANSALTYNPILQLSALPGDLAGQPGKTLMVAFGQKWNSNTSVSLQQTLFDKTVFTGLKAAKTTQQYYQL